MSDDPNPEARKFAKLFLDVVSGQRDWRDGQVLRDGPVDHEHFLTIQRVLGNWPCAITFGDDLSKPER